MLALPKSEPNVSHIRVFDSLADLKSPFSPQTYARIELQTLSRLPKTRAILFSFKTYLYPVESLKKEGLGPQVADAIEGLKTGNAPGMWRYKGAPQWGEPICKYLRS